MKCSVDSGLDPGPEKGHCGRTNGNILLRSVDWLIALCQC